MLERQDYMKRVELDISTLKSEEAVHDYFMEKMKFPEHYGKNLDALYDMLTDLPENICIELKRCLDPDSPIYDFCKKLEGVIEDAAQTIQFTEEGTMFAVFAGFEPLVPSSMW